MSDEYYADKNIVKGENVGNANIKYLVKDMCTEAEMSHAIIAYIYLN